MAEAKIADSTTVPISSLQLWDKNPRSIKTERFNELKERLKRQGQIKPLLVAKDGKTVIGGNMRLRAMKDLGIEEVWVSQTEATTDKEIFDLALTDNEEFGYYEQEQLAELALDLGLSPLELNAYEVTLGEPVTLTSLIDKFGPEDVEEDEVPEVDESEPPVSKLGEVYQLGRHRLMCGDSTDYDVIDRLMDSRSPDMIYTDPPYGIEHSGKGIDGSTGGNDFGSIIGDEDVQIAKDAYSLSVSNYPNASLVFWGANYYPTVLQDGYGWVVWDKQREGDTFSGAELAYTNKGTRLDVFRHQWHGMIKASEHGESRVHPTQKPIALAVWCFKNYGNPDIVLDLFGGSGSTLIACEQTNRTCYMMELDPKYCDVIRKRYANYIGKGDSWQEATPPIEGSGSLKAVTTPELSLTGSDK